MRVSTGIKNLDGLIEGGFIEKSFNLVYGGGGTGKTLFTINYLINGAEEGKNVLYISLEETWEDITRKLPQGLAERLEKVKDKFNYLDFGSLRPILGKEILKGDVLTEAITSSIVVHNIELVGLDGIAPLSMYYDDEKRVRSAIFDLSQNLKSYGVTTVFTSEEVNGMSRYGSEEYVADSVIKLTFDGKRRRLQIFKTRGSSFIGGTHGLEIRKDGLEVYPRVLFSEKKNSGKNDILGIQKLDNMLGETYTGDVTLITGPPGSGKHLFGLKFLKSGCAQGKKGVYVSFESEDKKIVEGLKEIKDASKLCKIVYIDALNTDIFKILWKLRALTQSANRLVIHKMNILADNEEYREFVHSLIKYVHNMGISTMITYTTSDIMATNVLGDEHVVNLADNIIKLFFAEINGELKKVLAIIKSHSPTHETGLIEYRLGKRGIVIVGKVEEMEGIMSGTPTKQLEIKRRVEKFFK